MGYKFRSWIKGPHLTYLGPNRGKWTQPHFNSIKLSIDVAWAKGKMLMAMLAKNYEREVLGL